MSDNFCEGNFFRRGRAKNKKMTVRRRRPAIISKSDSSVVYEIELSQMKYTAPSTSQTENYLSSNKDFQTESRKSRFQYLLPKTTGKGYFEPYSVFGTVLIGIESVLWKTFWQDNSRIVIHNFFCTDSVRLFNISFNKCISLCISILYWVIFSGR